MSVHDEIGPWSEAKLDIIREYAAAYSKILSSQRLENGERMFSHAYIDAFAGPGLHRSRTSGQFVPGSPLNALLVYPPFDDYYFIDIDRMKVEALRKLAEERHNVYVFEGDCNTILLREVFPKVRYEDHRRGLCLIDPYGLHLDWEIIETAGRMKTIDMFLNFPIMDAQRTVLWHAPELVPPHRQQRMTRFWGDDSWKTAAYQESSQLTLFGPEQEKARPESIVSAFRERLRRVAGFHYVPQPVAMRNSKGNVVYYLFFAAQKLVAADIVEDIFNKYRRLGRVGE